MFNMIKKLNIKTQEIYSNNTYITLKKSNKTIQILQLILNLFIIENQHTNKKQNKQSKYTLGLVSIINIIKRE